jgi:mannose-P-dolichol utilization defect protein 1
MDVLDLAKGVVTEVLSGKMPETDVLATLMSRILGLAIVLMSCIIKLPQIITLLRSKSAQGLSLTGFETELVAYTLTFSYGLHFSLPFSGYGESILMSAQDLVLLALIYKYAKTPFSHVATVVSFYMGGLAVLLSGQLGDEIMQALSAASFVTIMFARIPQIYANFKNGNTGQLSIFSYIITVFGGSVRIFTSYQDNAGVTMVVGYIISTSMNFIIALQILFLGSGVEKAATKKPAAVKRATRSTTKKAAAAPKKKAAAKKVEVESESEEEATPVRRRTRRTRA